MASENDFATKGHTEGHVGRDGEIGQLNHERDGVHALYKLYHLCINTWSFSGADVRGDEVAANRHSPRRQNCLAVVTMSCIMWLWL
jgi:hypothetical protein